MDASLDPILGCDIILTERDHWAKRNNWRMEKIMRRSEINAIMRDADAFMKANGFRLPPFAYWSPADWASKGEEVREIVDRQLAHFNRIDPAYGAGVAAALER